MAVGGCLEEQSRAARGLRVFPVRRLGVSGVQ